MVRCVFHYLDFPLVSFGVLIADGAFKTKAMVQMINTFAHALEKNIEVFHQCQPSPQHSSAVLALTSPDIPLLVDVPDDRVPVTP